MSIIDSLFTQSIGNIAKDIRTAITGKEVITSEERSKILDATKQLEIAALQADQAVIEAQSKTNEIEASSTSLFKSGWRPAVGWICVAGLAYQFLLRTILPWALQCFLKSIPEMPSLDMGTILMLLTGMLGLGSMRTFEKIVSMKNGN
jgi:hypothetical protein